MRGRLLGRFRIIGVICCHQLTPQDADHADPASIPVIVCERCQILTPLAHDHPMTSPQADNATAAACPSLVAAATDRATYAPVDATHLTRSGDRLTNDVRLDVIRTGCLSSQYE